MTNWEYAAIVTDGTKDFEGRSVQNWCLVKPGNEPHLVIHHRAGGNILYITSLLRHG